MYEASHKKKAAFITACNTESIEFSNKETKERNQKLEEKIQALHLDYIHSEGKCDDDEWLGEKSFLVFGINQKEAIQLGKEFAQNEIIWIPENSVPELLPLK